jgi:hypothetical protein
MGVLISEIKKKRKKKDFQLDVTIMTNLLTLLIF